MIIVICTGRGKHEPEEIAEVDPDAPMKPRRLRPMSEREQLQSSSATAREGYTPLHPNRTFHFPCGAHYEIQGRRFVCRVDAQYRPENWEPLISWHIAEGRDELDVSRFTD